VPTNESTDGGGSDDAPAAGETGDHTGDDEPMFDERITGYPWFLGVLAGTWTFVTGYLLMAGIMLPTANFAGGTVSKFKAFGQVLFNAHQVPLAQTLSDGSPVNVIGIPSNYLTETTPSLPVAVYFAVPIVVLLAAGLVLARSTVSGTDYEEYVLPGTALTVGYLGMALLARFLVEDTIPTEDGPVTWVPELVPTLIFGLLYPLVLGTLGALAVAVWRNRTASGTDQ
jgi:hypothetical protein